jgi:hypothetical protein
MLSTRGQSRYTAELAGNEDRLIIFDDWQDSPLSSRRTGSVGSQESRDLLRQEYQLGRTLRQQDDHEHTDYRAQMPTPAQFSATTNFHKIKAVNI